MRGANAIDLLQQDHDKVKDLLSQLMDTTNRAEKKRHELLGKIKHELEIHTRLEEEIFYPAFKQADGAEHRKMFFEAKEEHRAVEKLVIPDLEGTTLTSDEFHGRAKVLKELVEHHAQEEEDEMFPKARKTLSNDELVELGQRMQQRKQELQGRAEASDD
jgi:iron-sulfur cluster repair protein YtfE (RIC family)